LTCDGILDRFTSLLQPMIFLKVFFYSLHNTAGRAVANLALIARDLCKMPSFAQFLRQAQILILEISNIFL